MKTNRLLTMFTALILALSTYAYDFKSGDLYYDITSSTEPYTVKVTHQIYYSSDNYSGLTTVAIPTEVSNEGQTYSVTSIGDEAFSYCSSLTSITIPTSVTSIGYAAFHNCSSLTSITIPTSVTSIGDYAFTDCTGLTSLVFNAESCADFSYNGGAFYGLRLTSLQSVKIGETVTHIPANFIRSCKNVTSVTIPASVTSIGVGAFSGTSLTSLVYNSTNCPTATFSNLSTLNSVTIGSDVATIPTNFISGCSNVTSLIIPESVTSIGSNAFANTGLVSLVYNATNCPTATFSNLSTLNSVTIGSDVATIPTNFISGCSNVTSLIIPESVTSIGSSAFANTGLTSITIPTSVTSIGSSAFANTGLTSITIPTSVTSIGVGAFSGTSLTSLVYNSTNCPTATFSNFLTLDSVTIGKGVTIIPSKFISGCVNVTSLTIPESVTSIGSSAFANTGLTSITIPTSVTSIGSSAFANTGLTSITIPTSVTSIGSSAFANTGLTSITIPTSVTSIGGGAFSGTSLTSLVFNAASCADFFYPAPFERISTLQSVIIGDAVKSIPAYFLSRCSGVKSVTIPESVTNIGDYAFYMCQGLTSVSVPESVKTIGNWAFYDCSNITTATVSEGVKKIGDGAFCNTGITSVTIPASVTSIGSQAFVNSKLFSLIYNAESCENFTAPYYPFNGLTTLKVVTIGATVKSIPEYFIFGSSGVTSVTIPEGVTHIGASAFDACNNITRFIFEGNPTIESASSLLIDKSLLDTIAAPASVFAVPEIKWANCPKAIRYVKVTGGELFNDAFSVINRSYKTLNTLDLAAATNTQLADEAFKDCYSLENLQLPSSLERIGYMAVANCKNLKSVHVPASVTDIDDSAFENCRSITSLTFGDQADKSRQRSVQANSQLKRIGNWSFYNCHNLQSLTIPEGVTEIGSAAFYGCTYLQDLTLPGSLQQIGDNCFALCSKLNYITVNAMMPPTIEAKTFADVNRTIPLYVPAGSLEAYQSDIYWSEFMIVTEAPTAIKPVTIIEGVYAQNGTIVVEKDTNLPVAIYDVVGRLVVSGSSLTHYFEVPNAGVYIVKVGDQTMKVLVP